MAELYEIVDPRPAAASAPYTFFMPSPELVSVVRRDDLIKATIRSIPPSKEWDAERMWIRVTSVESDYFEGVLESEPLDMPGLRRGSLIRLPRSHVIDVILDDSEPGRVVEDEPTREYWERCLVDQLILDGQLQVGLVYRENPDMTGDDDKYPDSGWRIRGDFRGTSDDEMDDREVAYVALGAVLNADDSWLHLIDEPVGSRFEKDFERGIFVRESLHS